MKLKRTLITLLLITLLLISLTACSSVRPWTRNEKIALVTSIVATGINIHATNRALDHGCHEANPAIRWNPAIGMVVSEALAIWISHYWPEVRIPLLGTKTLVNTGLAVHDYRIKK